MFPTFRRLRSFVDRSARRPTRNGAIILVGGTTLALLSYYRGKRVGSKDSTSRDIILSDSDPPYISTAYHAIPHGKFGIARMGYITVTCKPNGRDAHHEDFFGVPSGDWSFFSLYDGHVQRAKAALGRYLVPAVVGSLADLYGHSPTLQSPGAASHSESESTVAIVSNTVKKSFSDLLDEIMQAEHRHSIASLASPRLLPPPSAALAFYESNTRLLRVASNGDSRAVLGRRTTNDEGRPHYEVHDLTKSHANHADATPRRGQFNVRAHEPQVTTTAIRSGDFLILATRPVWDNMPDEEAVERIGSIEGLCAIDNSQSGSVEAGAARVLLSLIDKCLRNVSENWGSHSGPLDAPDFVLSFVFFV